MVSTIDPVVHGTRRRYLTAMSMHVAGATLSAAVVGAVLGAAGALVGGPWAAAGPISVAVVALVYLVREATGLPVPLPDANRQVPEWWRTFFSPTTTAFLYGSGLGVGFATFLTFGTYVAVAVAAFVSGDPVIGIALCAPFGAARAIGVALVQSIGGGAEGGLDALERLSTSRWPRAANVFALGSVVLAAVLTLI